MTHGWRFSLIALVAVLAIAQARSPALAEAANVGAAAAVKPSSTGTPPGGQSAVLDVGSPIVEKERIRTTEAGSLQVMFNDKTTLTIGSNSDIVIDNFVYNANASTGQFGITMAKGALRFVGGQISHNDGVTITTPVATIGIRGGAALLTHDDVCTANADKNHRSDKDCTKVVCMAGVCTVNSLIDSRSIQLSISEAVEIGALGAMRPFDVDAVKLNEVTKSGDGGMIQGQSGPNQNSAPQTFAGQETIDETVAHQEQEPPPPPPPGP